jgi:predicted nucleic acid-binding protein
VPVRPLRDGNMGLLAAYDGFFSASRLAFGELSAAVIERATELRVRYWFSTPDAIHLVTAIEGGADVALTGDAARRRCREVTVEVLEL